jgi:hypothetical protein
MIDENFARLRTHRSNIQRYRHLLETSLTDLERQFIAKRLEEEQLAIETLSASMPATPSCQPVKTFALLSISIPSNARQHGSTFQRIWH